jgi:hypothetical protein
MIMKTITTPTTPFDDALIHLVVELCTQFGLKRGEFKPSGQVRDAMSKLVRIYEAREEAGQ